MLSIVAAIVFGVAFTFIAIQNPGLVAVNFFGASFALPLFVLVAITFLVGVLLALILRLIDTTTATDSREWSARLKDSSKVNEQLNSHITNLQKENSDLRERLGKARAELAEENLEHERVRSPGLFGRLRESLT